ncbi:MAG: Uma2 family endonuclease [Bacteroidetes bacterium]|nr:Uma2 family endonuclease [Fibrella sp.]
MFTENIEVEVVRDEYLPYPDVIFTCHPFDLQSRLIIRQPSLLVEVLSDSSEKKDRGFKWLQYKTMPSLLYYLLVDQYVTSVELFSRVENTDVSEL